MRALTDEQLHAVHEHAQQKVAERLVTGYADITREYSRQARAAEREILSRGHFTDAKNHRNST